MEIEQKKYTVNVIRGYSRHGYDIRLEEQKIVEKEQIFCILNTKMKVYYRTPCNPRKGLRNNINSLLVLI